MSDKVIQLLIMLILAIGFGAIIVYAPRIIDLTPIEHIETLDVGKYEHKTEKKEELNLRVNVILGYINKTRVENKLGELATSNGLMLSAKEKAEHMVANDYWDHVAPDGTTPWYFISKHYKYVEAGENLAKGYTNNLYQHQAWMNSPTHKEVILGDFTHFGYHRTTYNDGAALVVTHFGR